MITVGRMAEKYGMLPSQIEQHATTYDIMVNDVLATYDEYEQQKASGKIDPSVFKLTTEEMQNMLERANG